MVGIKSDIGNNFTLPVILHYITLHLHYDKELVVRQINTGQS